MSGKYEQPGGWRNPQHANKRQIGKAIATAEPEVGPLVCATCGCWPAPMNRHQVGTGTVGWCVSCWQAGDAS